MNCKTPLAHSARSQDEISAQSYKQHICNVADWASWNAQAMCRYCIHDMSDLQETVRLAAIYHDLGKLDPKNQDVLKSSAGKGLPVRHEDAGAAFLLQEKNIPAAILAGKHHQGLPALYEEKVRKKFFLRDEEAYQRTNTFLDDYITCHQSIIPKDYVHKQQQGEKTTWKEGLYFRLALSCLVDGDHGDTARHYGNEHTVRSPDCRWHERQTLLKKYTDNLFRTAPDKERNILRQQIFHECSKANVPGNIVACDSPVGTGKTTSVMTYLLKTAIENNLRHIIVVLPYTNIIKQSVDVYRKALVLPGESQHEVVAEHHHQADFENMDTRHLATLWKTPIIVTTAVQFFETIAANKPAKLRKLHELPGSAIFIDEVHAAIPSWMWPQMWKWINQLAEDWNCHFVLASGSLPQFWKFPQIALNRQQIPELVPDKIRAKAHQAETRRIRYRTVEKPLSLTELVELILSTPGPRLVVMNTVQSAAVVAKELFRICSEDGRQVVHLSTALCPNDREKVVEQVNNLLTPPISELWTLVATSCVEAGMDFSFATALRESCSVASLIQIGGRANRHADNAISEIWDFRTDNSEKLLNQHPSFRVSRMVLAELFAEKKMNTLTGAELATEAMRREIMTEYNTKAGTILNYEKKFDFPAVAKLCRVIESDTKLVVISPEIIRKIEQREKIEKRELLRHSVQLWPQKIEYIGLQEITPDCGLYKMPTDYYSGFRKDSNKPCFGYMKGLLPLVYAHRDGLVI